MVYHYTTIEVLFNMLESYRLADDRNHLVFWASNALDQNDTQEMPLKYNELCPVLAEVENKLKEEGNKIGVWKLSDIEKYGRVLDYNSEDVENEINQAVEHPFFTPYTISFSRKKDVLLMWSIYANNGNGICLAFDEKRIKVKSTGLFSISDNVFYDKKKEKYLLVVKKIYEEFLRRFTTTTPILNNHYFIMRGALRAMLGGISPFIKNMAFKDEKEWRISNYIVDDNVTQVHKRITRKMNVINYVKIGIPLSALKHIIIGPCVNYEKVRGLLIKKSLECDIQEMGKESFYIKSQVPYREF